MYYMLYMYFYHELCQKWQNISVKSLISTAMDLLHKELSLNIHWSDLANDYVCYIDIYPGGRIF